MSREFSFFSKSLSLIFYLGIHSFCFGQMELDTAKGPDFLVRHVLKGNGVLVGNVRYTGPKHAIAYFKDDSLNVGIREGIMLTTGNVFLLSGPNHSTFTSWVNGTSGDKQLELIARGRTYDAAVLEFEFITASENLSFNFVFGSEEYLEYVDSKYNDVFAFFISGPGHDNTNIAMLPDGKTPITVNTVNNKRNSKYYVGNEYINTTDPILWDARKRHVIKNPDYQKPPVTPPYNIQFDGFTRVLQATCKVVPNERYHIKIAIADVSDPILDSGVFLEGGSFSSYGRELVSLIEDPFETIDSTEQIKTDDNIQAQLTDLDLAEEPEDIVPQLMNIEFEFDKFDIPLEGFEMLTGVYNLLNKYPHRNLLIAGHTDSIGSSTYNRWLSFMRSMMVFNTLNDMGVPGERMSITYFGEDRPLKNNNSAFGRARNRRVELLLIRIQ